MSGNGAKDTEKGARNTKDLETLRVSGNGAKDTDKGAKDTKDP